MEQYQNIRLEKGMYQRGAGSFLKSLEELDPSSRYQGSALQKTDAFERQLRRFDLRVSGPHSSRLEKFFDSGEAAVLFPEYVARAVGAGLREGSALSQMVAATTVIDGEDYRTVTSQTVDVDGPIPEGGEVPETAIRTQKNLVRLKKRGRLLSASYESVRYQRLELFTVTLRQIGRMIGKAQMEDAVDALMHGDGNSGAAEVVTPESTGSLTYGDLLRLWGKFSDHQMNAMVADGNMIGRLAALEEFQNPLTGLNFAGTGMLSTPLGAALIKSEYVGEGQLIALDQSCALEKICARQDGVAVEYDKLMHCQLERAAITSTVGFAKIFPDAVKVLHLA